MARPLAPVTARDSAVVVVMPLGHERATVHGSNVEHGPFQSA